MALPLRGSLKPRISDLRHKYIWSMALVHKHVIIRAEVLDPPTDENIASNQVKDLIDQIGMKILMGPYAK